MTDVPANDSGGVRGRWGVPRCGYYSNALMLWVGMRFLWLAYVMVWFAALYFYFFVGKARRGSLKYLDRISPGRGWAKRQWQTYRHLVTFGYLLLDRAVMLMNSKHGFAISCDGLEHLTKVSASGGGLLVLTAHFGNAEIAAPYFSKLGFTHKVHIVMYMDTKDGTEKFHARHRKLLDKIEIISTTDPLSAGVRIIRAIKEGGVVAMRADRTMSGKMVSATLLGGRISLPAGPFVSGAICGAPMVSIYTCRIGYRRYHCIVRPMKRCGDEAGGTRDERMNAAAQEYADGLEQVLRKYPYQWSNFYDYWQVQGAE